MTRAKKLLAVVLAALLLFGVTLPAFAAEAPFENSRYFETGDYRIHYRVFEANEPKGQVFMIHGFALSSYCFQALAERLQAGGYTCVIADLPNFGYSTRETQSTNMLPREDIMHALMTTRSRGMWRGTPWAATLPLRWRRNTRKA